MPIIHQSAVRKATISAIWPSETGIASSAWIRAVAGRGTRGGRIYRTANQQGIITIAQATRLLPSNIQALVGEVARPEPSRSAMQESPLASMRTNPERHEALPTTTRIA